MFLIDFNLILPLIFFTWAIASNDKSLSLLSDILLRATVLMSFILLEVLSLVVDDTGIVIVPIRSERIATWKRLLEW